jgi:hypothetical protein
MSSEVLDKIFEDIFIGAAAAAEEEVTFFSGAVAKVLNVETAGEALTQLSSTKPGRVSPSDALITERRGRVEIQYGWVESDYVWHFTPTTNSGGWGVSADRVLYLIAQTMNAVIPKTVKVDVFKPMLEWEIKAISFKALNLKMTWNVSEEDIKSLTDTLFDVLSKLK